jgi:DNA-directed RNA polymerase specialized sigma24 family protein
LEKWTEFHKHVAALPGSDREVCELLWYFGLSQQEAADFLGISLRTIKRRWFQVRCLLVKQMESEQPD